MGGSVRNRRRPLGCHLFAEAAAQVLLVGGDTGVGVLVPQLREPGMAGRGLAYDDLATTNPALVYTSISPFGQTGIGIEPFERHAVAIADLLERHPAADLLRLERAGGVGQLNSARLCPPGVGGFADADHAEQPDHQKNGVDRM